MREETLPQANIYSNKTLFEQADDRIKKRIAQMLKRKSAFSVKNNSKENEKNKSPIKTSIIKNTNIDENILINDLNQKKDVKNKIEDNIEQNDEIISELNLENNNISNIKKHFVCESNIINLDNSPILSNNNIINENNYYNNSSTNNSYNNSITFRDSQEKEVNISNLDNNSIDDIIINKEDNNIEEDFLNINNDNDRILSKSLYNYDHDDDFMQNKEEKIKEENEFALKYLTSSSDSFVQLDNHLVARAKVQGGEITESYLQALFPDMVLDQNKPLKTKNYEVTEIIKEEREIESPFGKTNNFYTNNSKTSRIALHKDLKLKNWKCFEKIKKLNKPLVRTKSNALLLRKRKNLKRSKTNKDNINSNINNKTLKLTKYKSVSNFKNLKKIIKNNNNTKKKKLNISCSHLNINNNKIKNNKDNFKIKNELEFNSTFSFNMYERRKANNRNQNKIQKTFTNLLDKEDDLNDALLIHNCIKTIGKSKNLKINKHYLKNINFYENHKEMDNKNKIIKKRNQKESGNNKINLESNFLKDSSKLNHLNTTDIIKKPKYVLMKNNSRQKLNKNLKIVTNANLLEKINNNVNKSFTHINNASSFSCNEQTKPKKYLTKNNRVKSLSRLIIKKHKLNDILNSETNIERAKSNHKKLNILAKSEYINTENSFMKMKARKNKKSININKNINNMNNNNTLSDKRKFITSYKKIDYSYVKAKVETGLSEDAIKRLLNNNKKLANKEHTKKIEKDKKQCLFKKCKTNMNRTIEAFKKIASNIKQKLFKKNRNEK